MFAKSALALVSALAAASQVAAHAAIAPALGVSGTPVRNDVQRPSANAPCGNINVAQTLATSTPIVAAADGTFSATVINFNAGADGSRSVAATVDADGTGANFVAAQVTTNGDAAPTDVTSQQITAALPAGTTCTGGGKGLCLVSFTTTAGFGNCVVVQQAAAAGTAAAAGNAAGAGAAAAAAASTTAAAATPPAATTAAAAAAAAGTTGKKHHKGGKKAAAKAAAAAAAPAAAAAANQAKAEAKAHAKRALALRFARHLTERDE